MELLHQLHERLRPVKLSAEREDIVMWKFDNKVGRVNTKERLARLGVHIQSDSACVLCTKETESAEHLFLRCEVTWQVWCHWVLSFRREWVIPGTIKDLFESWRGMHNRQQRQKVWMTAFFAVIWNIWLERNARIFNNTRASIEGIQTKTVLSYTEWCGWNPL
ncbi:uncharacterized protein LOC107607312 [Arachis ipaensis]|uniref:uncharacterized protein LOC107607312 n=1 Tax=Arachis ipaensis TaxID=130454 RepID=UPI0007AFD51B|nr:uncharacterized protein LOC107607312 [Arachis ipaensis]XP_025664811.1 uncharacterized protein LOC112763326 [Arachis hypogaea]